jgi:hypothetical protein
MRDGSSPHRRDRAGCGRIVGPVDTHLDTALTAAVLGFMGVRLVGGVRHARTGAGRALTTTIVRGVGWRHVWPVPLVLTGVLVVAAPLMSLPVLSWGWWSAMGGTGNPVFGSSTATAGGPLELVIPLVFLALLVPALPLFAHAEEVLFRRGAEGWSKRRRALKVVQFGMVHALIGIPIGAALALSVGGAYFMGVYLRAVRGGLGAAGATIESARAHAVYNAVIVVLVLVTLAAGGLT